MLVYMMRGSRVAIIVVGAVILLLAVLSIGSFTGFSVFDNLFSHYYHNYVGTAQVYLIDPTTTPNLTRVNLTNLDGSGYLRGRYVNVVNTLYSGEKIPTPRVRSINLSFIYQPTNFSLNLTPNRQLGYWGHDDLSDSGHRFRQAEAYYYMTEAAKYFVNNFGFRPKKAVEYRIYDVRANVGGYQGNYVVVGAMPKLNDSVLGDIRGDVHEYTHLVQHDYVLLPYNTLDQQGLVESFAKYFECAFTNTSADPYIYDAQTGIKQFSNYSQWNYTNASGKAVAFVLASTWWQMRQEIGENVSDKLVYNAMTEWIRYRSCAASDALVATLKADDKLYRGIYKQKIIEIFGKHNIFQGKCFDIR